MPHLKSDKQRTRPTLERSRAAKKAGQRQPKAVLEIAAPAAKEDDGQGHPYLSFLGMTALETPQLIARIHAGLPIQALTEFAQHTGFAAEVCARAAQIPLSSLRRRKPEGRLHPDESDRLVRNARVYAQALRLFADDAEQTRRWLTSPQSALGDVTPLDFAATDVGSREVESLIGRLEHGIPS